MTQWTRTEENGRIQWGHTKELEGGGTYTICAAPKFSSGTDQPSLATLYSSHYDRLIAVLAAARTGNRLLLKLAVEYQDSKGASDEDRGLL